MKLSISSFDMMMIEDDKIKVDSNATYGMLTIEIFINSKCVFLKTTEMEMRHAVLR